MIRICPLLMMGKTSDKEYEKSGGDYSECECITDECEWYSGKKCAISYLSELEGLRKLQQLEGLLVSIKD